MFKNLIKDGSTNVLRFFPERQIYLRSGGEVSYHTITTRVQVTLIALLVAMLTWCAITFANLALGNNPLRTPNEKNKLVEAEYKRLLDDAEAKYELAQLQLSEQQETFEMAAKNFQEKHAALAQFVSAPEGVDVLSLGQDIHKSKGEVLVAPVVRETVGRRARTAMVRTAQLRTGTALDAPMASLDREQTNILLSAEDKTFDRIERNRAIIEATNLDLKSILNSGLTGLGGPLIDISDDQANALPGDPRLTQLQARAEEARRLENVMKSIPLAHPVAADYYRTSTFGVRKDPFTKRPARHHAIDFASYRMAPIVATADGVVKSVTVSKGGYGRLIEIDHGYGFVTRYAHLAKSYVKRGQKVSAGDTIAGMGSTGRSSGTHLHYEVRFHGSPQNPDNFLKAGRYVQQN